MNSTMNSASEWKTMNQSASQKSLFSVTSGSSDLSLFRQHLPQERQRFCVGVASGRRKGAITSRNACRHVAYDFTVFPRANSPRSRENSPTRTNSPLQSWVEEDSEIQDDHFAFLTGRTFFRHQRLDRFNSGRQFPALVTPRFLPSFKRVTDGMAKSRQEFESDVLPTKLPNVLPEKAPKAFVKTTISACRQRQVRKHTQKMTKHGKLPFIPCGGGTRRKGLPCRTPGGVQDAYDSVTEAQKEECRNNRGKLLGPPFKPSCARPKQKDSPHLSSFCRSQMMSSTSPSMLQRFRAFLSEETIVVTNKEHTGPESSSPDSASGRHTDVSDAGERSPRPKGGDRGSPSLSTCHQAPSSDRWKRGSEDKSSLIPLISTSEVKSSLIPQLPLLQEDSMLCQMKNLEKKQAEKKETETIAVSVFKRLADEGKIHHDDMTKALTLLGFVSPQMDWVDEVWNQMSKYISISLDDFMRFLKDYEAAQRAAYKAEFEKCDKDGSGTVEASELLELMKSLGIEPMKHVLDKVIDEVDENQNGDLDFAEFESVMDILRKREGFAKEEYDEIFTLFHRFDRDGSGTMDTKEIHVALQWLGFNFSEAAADAIIKEIDEDQSGQIDVGEWFVCMRKVRETKIKKLREVMAESDVDNDGTIQYSELQTLLRAMGYVPDFDAVFEAAEQAHIQPDDEDLDLGELWRLLAVYREREGLNAEDLDQVETAFRRYAERKADISEDDEVGIVDIGKMVRSIGYVIDFEMQQNLTNKVDIDGSGRLDSREFRKMVRMIHEKDVEMFRSAFDEAAVAAAQQAEHAVKAFKALHTPRKGCEGRESRENPSRDSHMTRRTARHENTLAMIPTLTLDQALQALQKVSCTDSQEVLESFFDKDAAKDNEIDFFEFVQAAIRSRRMARAAFRDNGGFSEEQIGELRESFDKYDADHSGEISGAETVVLFQTEFPMIANDPARRSQLVQIIREADEDGNGSLDFKDFLRIMRQLRDMQDQLRISKELAAVISTRFSPPEVQEFRELFIGAGDGEKELGFDDVKELLKCIVPMGTKNVQELRHQFDEMSSMEMGVLKTSDHLDFPEFLWLMRALLDMNFANMADKASAIVGESHH